MSSKSVILKRKAAMSESSLRTGSSPGSFARKKSACSSPLSMQAGLATSSMNPSSRGTPKVDLDKENNNSVAAKHKQMSTTPRGAVKNMAEKGKVYSSVTVTLRESHKRSRSRESPVVSKKAPERSDDVSSKSTGTSSSQVCAAVTLSSSTSAMARRHRRSVSSDRFQQLVKSEAIKPGPATARRSKRSQMSSPVRADREQTSPVQKTSPRKKLLPETDKYLKGSPSMKSIPSNMVRKMIKNIQDKPPSSPRKEMMCRSPTTNKCHISDQRKSLHLDPSDCNSSSTAPEDFSVTVAVRVRPFSQREKDLGSKQVIFMNGNETVVSDGISTHSFVYDFSFNSIEKSTAYEFANQSLVYEKLARPLLSSAFNGYNTCLFAYGQTGSGKSYTIMGHGEDVGVIPRFCDEMFSGVRSVTAKDDNIHFHIEMSYFEIYNEKIHDLLVSPALDADGEKKKQALRVREHPEDGPYVEGLSTFLVTKFDDIQSWLDVGNQQRVTASTGMNDKSSRSHSVFILNMIRTTTEDLEGEKHESSRRSRINLVDLAGSERSSTAQTSGQRLKISEGFATLRSKTFALGGAAWAWIECRRADVNKFIRLEKALEGASINKSLLTLGKVISSLSDRSSASVKAKRRIFVPYRDSALTWLLKESLGGNSRTAMIATISPADSHMDETMSTLRYATQARSIVNLVKVNEDPNAVIIRELKSEIAKLRAAHQSPTVNVEEYRSTVREVAQLRERLSEAENAKSEANAKWRQKLEESERRKAEEIGELKRAGVSFKVDNSLPNLVNLNEDPQLSELLLYVIKHGKTRIGRKGGSQECEIQLSGALIADLHCEIENKNEVVTITPRDASAKVFINGEIINQTAVLHHGDRVVIAGDHFFRLNHPIEVQQKSNKRNSGGKAKDFAFARDELLAAQNERMQAEIEQTRLRVKQEMLKEIEIAKAEAHHEIKSQKKQYEEVVQTLQSQLEKDRVSKTELEAIREEKDILQKEVEANRVKQVLEAKALEKKVIDKRELVKSQIIAELESERLKLKRDIERLESRKRGRQGAKSKTFGKWTPLRVSFLLEEANNISATLRKHTIFARHEDDVNGGVQIKLENTKLGIWTLWPIEKLEEKLECMREVYEAFRLDKNSENDSDGENMQEDNLFYDPTDTWTEIFVTDDTTDAASYHDATPASSRPRQSKKLTRRLSSLAVTRNSPALQQSLQQLDQQSESSLREKDDHSSVYALCRSAITSFASELEEPSDSPADLLLISLHHLAFTCESLADGYYSSPGGQQGSKDIDRNRTLCLELTIHLKGCLSAVRTFRHVVLNGAQCSKSNCVSKLIRQLTEAGKKLVSQAAKLTNGYENDIEQVFTEASTNIRSLIANIAKYCGALSLATETSSSVLEEDRQLVLHHRIKNAFLQGGDAFVRKTINGGIEKLKQYGDTNSRKEISNLISTAVNLLQSCKDLQDNLRAALVREILNRRISSETQRMYETTMQIRESNFPTYYYHQYVRRARCMIAEVACLVSGLQDLNGVLLNVSEDERLSEMDMCSYEEALRQPALRLAEMCTSQEGLMPAIKEALRLSESRNCSNNNNTNSTVDTSIALEEQNERFSGAVQNTAEAFHNALIAFASDENTSGEDSKHSAKSFERSLNVSSRRGSGWGTDSKRISGPTSMGSFVISAAVQKWLELADHTNCG